MGRSGRPQQRGITARSSSGKVACHADARRPLKAEETLIHVLWINAGLSCDGDSVALTAATQPSIEEIALGALPGLPQIAVHWPLIDFECGPEGGQDDFLEWFRKADRGQLDPFVLVLEGSIANESIKSEGYWGRYGDGCADWPAHHHVRVAQSGLAPKAWAVVGAGTCATYGGIHAMQGNPTGCMGVADYSGLELALAGRACLLSTCPVVRCSQRILMGNPSLLAVSGRQA